MSGGRDRSTALVLLVAFAAAAIIVSLGRTLPPSVASNFGASGSANAFMPRAAFVTLMLILASALPVLTWLLVTLSVRRGRARIPNAAYWMSPSNHARAVGATETFAVGFAIALATFLVWVFWLVVVANRAEPPTLPFWPFVLALVGFLTFTVVWIVRLWAFFRGAPPAGP